MLHHSLLLLLTTLTVLPLGSVLSQAQVASTAADCALLKDPLMLFTGGTGGTVDTLLFSPSSGTLENVSSTSEAGSNPSWITIFVDPDDDNAVSLYVTDEFSDGVQDGISLFSADAEGKLTRVAQAPVGAAGPVHAGVFQELVGVPDFGAGALQFFSVNDDGQPVSSTLFFEGSGPVAERQDSSHPHQVVFDPSGKFMFMTDLGDDAIFSFRIENDTQPVRLKSDSKIQFPPGSGPRHMTFLVPTHTANASLLAAQPASPEAQAEADLPAFVINEISNIVFLCNLNSTGSLNCDQSFSSLVGNTAKESSAAEILVSPDLKFVYVSNRATNAPENDTIVGFEFDQEQNSLTGATAFEVGGRGARHFSIDSSGCFLAVGLQETGVINIFARDPGLGSIGETPLASIEAEGPEVVVWNN